MPLLFEPFLGTLEGMKQPSIILALTFLLATPATAAPQDSSKILDRFLQYLHYDTKAIASKDSPSNRHEMDFSNALAKELRDQGIDSQQDRSGNLFVTIKGNVTGKPTVGFIAHLDSSVKAGTPMVNRNYSGYDLKLKQGILGIRENPDLQDYIGADIVSGDGKSPIGIDNKAGVAICMTAIERLKKSPKLQYGDVKFAFLTDETSGRAFSRFDPKVFGADIAYFVDGGPLGEISNESFCASTVVVSIFGKDALPGYAKGRMINTLPIAARFLGRIPQELGPERSDKRQGFVHPLEIRGNVSKSTITLQVRDFDLAELTKKEIILRAIAGEIQQKYPQAKITLEVKPSYRNLKTFLDKNPKITQNALEAFKALNISPIYRPVRGSSDCTEFAQRGLLTMGLFTGGYNLNQPNEWIPVPAMLRAVDAIEEITTIWAKSK
jgi:tripeptide aminopeptidase